jgi:pimeloyl-ACP methyl ester carboxylesterase
VSIKSIAEDAKEIMKQLEIPAEKTIAVGHSMGGIVVAELAQLSSLHAVVMVGPVLPKEALGGVFNARVEIVSKGKSSHIT